jgi:hypothetical protein
MYPILVCLQKERKCGPHTLYLQVRQIFIESGSTERNLKRKRERDLKYGVPVFPDDESSKSAVK